MGSHKGVGRLQLYVPSPMRFKKKPSAFNLCIGNQLKGQPGPKLGRYDVEFQKRFTKAVHSCAGKTPKKGGVATEKVEIFAEAEAEPVVIEKKAKPKAVFPLLS